MIRKGDNYSHLYHDRIFPGLCTVLSCTMHLFAPVCRFLRYCCPRRRSMRLLARGIIAGAPVRRCRSNSRKSTNFGYYSRNSSYYSATRWLCFTEIAGYTTMAAESRRSQVSSIEFILHYCFTRVPVPYLFFHAIIFRAINSRFARSFHRTDFANFHCHFSFRA